RVENLELDLEFQHLDAPKDFIIPVRNSMKSIFIHEVENTAFVNLKMIKYMVENNPDLCKFNLYFSSLETYRMVVETIVQEELSRSNKDCLHKHISLGLGISRDDDPSELLNYLNSGEFPYNFTHGEYDLYEGTLECPACGGVDSIEILGKRFV
uniref:Arginine decarboxylase n=1 Tax=Strongyloides papillosus TaxID=174720 RepID=A0A0N5BUU6_STREA